MADVDKRSIRCHIVHENDGIGFTEKLLRYAPVPLLACGFKTNNQEKKDLFLKHSQSKNVLPTQIHGFIYLFFVFVNCCVCLRYPKTEVPRICRLPLRDSELPGPCQRSYHRVESRHSKI